MQFMHISRMLKLRRYRMCNLHFNNIIQMVHFSSGTNKAWYLESAFGNQSRSFEYVWSSLYLLSQIFNKVVKLKWFTTILIIFCWYFTFHWVLSIIKLHIRKSFKNTDFFWQMLIFQSEELFNLNVSIYQKNLKNRKNSNRF